MAKKSKRWLDEHHRDHYVRMSKEAGYRSRASYKLLEIQDKYRLMSPGDSVVDLGAAPGGFSQVALAAVGDHGHVVAVDLLPIQPMAGVVIIEGDFAEDAVLESVLSSVGDSGVDLVLSDMAPNLSGMKDIDQPRSVFLVELAVDFAARTLRPGGALLVKCFEGSGIDDVRKTFRDMFERVNNIKPDASRGRSREIFLLGRGLRG